MAEQDFHTDGSLDDSELEQVSGGADAGTDDLRKQEQGDKLRKQEQGDKLSATEQKVK